jgi:CxxC-x17-CxxC domain-containing protein
MQQEVTFFAKTNFRNQQRVFGIKADDRRRHMYVIGKTGMGKTNLLENLVIQDIQHGHGVAFIDPHGDTAEKLIKAIPSHRINDVIYFNPADQDYPLAFNVMEKVGLEHRHLVASGLVGVFKKIWADSWGPRLEYILRNAILALLEYPGSTLLGVTRILVDKDYRKRVVEKVSDPVVRSFWVDEFTKWNDRVLQEVIAPIQNKVGQFLSSSLIRNIVGQTKSSFDVREAMDNRKILIMNLSKGRIGEDNSALLGAMMITKIQLAAMGRVDIAEEERKDFYLYVDEFQNFATESFANILSEARKYRLNLILANQYIAQLDEKVRDAIFGNAGTIISFRVGAADAEFLEKEFEPIFMTNDLVNLPKYHVYLKLMIDGVAGDAFSATVLPPIALKETEGNEEKIIRISRERYASKKQDVEDKIRRWSGMLTEEERLALLSRSVPRGAEHEPSVPASRSAFPGSNQRLTRPVARSFSSQISEQHSLSLKGLSPASSSQNHATPSSLTSSAPSNNLVRPRETGFTPSVYNLVSTQAAEPAVPKPSYRAVCVVCDTEIEVPFKPDGKRPTFCKDHLRDYQRALSRAKNEDEESLRNNASDAPEGKRRPGSLPKAAEHGPEEIRQVQAKAYVPEGQPLSLRQMEYIAPKKFTAPKQKPALNLDEIRNLIRHERPSENQES